MGWWLIGEGLGEPLGLRMGVAIAGENAVMSLVRETAFMFPSFFWSFF